MPVHPHTITWMSAANGRLARYMLMKSRILTLALVAAISGVASAANLVTNHSFELPARSGSWGQGLNDGIAGGWYAEVDLLEIGAASVYGVTGQDGQQVLELDSDNNIKASQNLATTAQLGYTISFSAALRANVASSSQGGDILWNDQVIGSFLPSSTVMQSYSFNVIGTGADKLSFVGTGTNDSYGTLVDNVNVEAVPEPATLAVLAVGLAAARRRKKA